MPPDPLENPRAPRARGTRIIPIADGPFILTVHLHPDYKGITVAAKDSTCSITRVREACPPRGGTY